MHDISASRIAALNYEIRKGFFFTKVVGTVRNITSGCLFFACIAVGEKLHIFTLHTFLLKIFVVYTEIIVLINLNH